MIEIFHGLYQSGLGRYIVNRCNWDFEKGSMKPVGERFTTPRYADLPAKLVYGLDLFMDKFISKFWKDRIISLLEFTLAVDTDTGLKSLAIVHPNDQFVRKVGYEITSGRVKRQRGDLGRPKYQNDPKFAITTSRGKFAPIWIYDPKLKAETKFFRFLSHPLSFQSATEVKEK